MPAEVPLTSRAAERLSREASVQGFHGAAKALSIDWHRRLDGKQVERWSEKLGVTLTGQRDAEVLKLQEGRHPPDVAADPALLVVEVDGGRWQGREVNVETSSRWREDKVCAIATYLPGDGKDREPQRLLTTYTATTRDAEAFGPMCRLEAERRGLRQAEQVIALADGGNWIDTKHQEHMNYPEYRRRGWPIGSGVVEAGVKQFNKRVKGTDQFWNEQGIEPILSLRALWLSQDDRWQTYWASRPAYSRAA